MVWCMQTRCSLKIQTSQHKATVFSQFIPKLFGNSQKKTKKKEKRRKFQKEEKRQTIPLTENKNWIQVLFSVVVFYIVVSTASKMIIVWLKCQILKTGILAFFLRHFLFIYFVCQQSLIRCERNLHTLKIYSDLLDETEFNYSFTLF